LRDIASILRDIASISRDVASILRDRLLLLPIFAFEKFCLPEKKGEKLLRRKVRAL